MQPATIIMPILMLVSVVAGQMRGRHWASLQVAAIVAMLPVMLWDAAAVAITHGGLSMLLPAAILCLAVTLAVRHLLVNGQIDRTTLILLILCGTLLGAFVLTLAIFFYSAATDAVMPIIMAVISITTAGVLAGVLTSDTSIIQRRKG